MFKNKVLGVLFVTLLLDMIGIGMLIPLIPTLFTDASSPSFLLAAYSENARYVIAGLITALFGAMQFLAAPVLGELSDLYGRKKLLALGVGVLALSNLVFAVGIMFGSVAVLLVSRAIAGVAGANFSIAQAAIADVSAPQDRAKNFGLIGAAFGLGFILGPFLGGWLSGTSGNPALPFICAGMLGLINVNVLWALFPETRTRTERTRKITFTKAFRNVRAAWRDVDVRPLYAVSFLSMLGFAFFTSFVSIYLVSRFGFSETDTGMYFAAIGVWIVIAQGFVIRIFAAKYHERQLLMGALPVLAAVVAIYPFVPHVGLLYALMPLNAISFGLISTSLPALVSKGVGPDRQGAALGINGSLQALTQGIAPLVAGFIAGLFGLGASFFVGALLMFAALVVVMRTHAK